MKSLPKQGGTYTYGRWLHRVVWRQQGVWAEVARPQEAFAGNSVKVTSQSVDQSKSQAQPSLLGGVEKEDVHSREKSNNSIANMMEEFMAIFIIYHHLQIWKVYFLLMLHVCCGLRGVLLHIIPHEEMWDEGFLPPPRICWVGFPCWGKDSSEESCRKWDASVQEWQESLNQSPSKVSDKVTPDLRGVGGNVFIMHL